MTSEQLYQQGNDYRRQGLWHEAINCYIQAAELDPESPAVTAKKILEDILSYRNNDFYNP